MARRRRDSGDGIDLFAFQDIITGTTGILIVITLLMSLTIGAKRIEDVLNERKKDGALQQQALEARARYNALQSEREQRVALQSEIEAQKEKLCKFLQADVEALKRAKLPDLERDKQRRIIPPTSASLRNPLTVVAVEQHFELLEENGSLRTRLDFALGPQRLQQALHAELSRGDWGGCLFLIKPSAFLYCAEIAHLGIQDEKLLFPFSYDIIPEDWQVSLQ
jgi:hypothetical protein